MPSSSKIVTQPQTSRQQLDTEAFSCEEESSFYSDCLIQHVFGGDLEEHRTAVEFGTGDGTPVIRALKKTGSKIHVQGFEIHPKAYQQAQHHISQAELGHQFHVKHQSFFDHSHSADAILISNPPYIPAPDTDLLLPELYGGPDGNQISQKLLSLGFQTVCCIVSGFSDPLGLLDVAQAQGYHVVDFTGVELPFGVYSSEPKVQQQIAQMRQEGKAFFKETSYRIAGALFEKTSVESTKTEKLKNFLMYQ